MKHILAIGGCYHQNQKNVNKNHYIDMAAHSLFYSLISGFSNKCRVDVINEIRRPSFFNHDVLYNSFSKANDGNITYWDVSYINLFGIKMISKAISVLRYTMEALKQNPDISNCIIYSIHTPYLLPVVYLARKNIKTTIIVPDLPIYMDTLIERKRVKSFVKKIDARIQNSLLQKVKSYVVISKYMAQELKLKDDEYIVVEGVVDAALQNNDYSLKYNKGDKKIVTYTGQINEKYGIGDLVETFRNIIPDIELWLFGSGDYSKVLRTIGVENIKYFGQVSKSEISYVQRISDILVNPRSASEEYTKYSFPSKIMEYMQSGTPVLCQRLMGIPDEYDCYLNYVNGESPEDWKAAIERILDPKNNYEYVNKAQMGKEFIIQNKNNISQSKKILEFMQK